MKRSVGEFVRSLAEAVLIVLLVSFFSLGLRTGLVVALSIPLVLAMTFLFMQLFGIGLHKISLGALILALGLLVDDAIIAVEMMAMKMEQGLDRLRAASFAYTSTAFPMLTGTLVTAPASCRSRPRASSTGEYTRSIFQVITIALLRVLDRGGGVRPLPRRPAAAGLASEGGKPSRLARLLRRFAPRLAARLERAPQPHPAGRRRTASARSTRRRSTGASAPLVHWCVAHRKTVIALTALAFVGVDPRVPLRAAAVLPGVDPPGADGRPAARRGLLARRDRGRGEALREGARARGRASTTT